MPQLTHKNQILNLHKAGRTAPEIAALLDLSRQAVYVHLRNLQLKPNKPQRQSQRKSA